MDYHVLMELDSDSEPVGFHVTFTSSGPVMVVFSRPSRRGIPPSTQPNHVTERSADRNDHLVS